MQINLSDHLLYKFLRFINLLYKFYKTKLKQKTMELMHFSTENEIHRSEQIPIQFILRLV